MGLSHLQAAMAQLCTSPAARAFFLSNPEAFAEQASLTAEDLAALRATAETSLESFARSLLHKRAQEVARAIPLTREALDGTFAGIFEAYAATSPVARDPALDACHFLEWLPSHQPDARPVHRIARYELAWLRMRRGRARFHCGIYRLSNVAKRFFAIWWRPHKAQPCQYWQWPNPKS